jgi:hypothetical protein
MTGRHTLGGTPTIITGSALLCLMVLGWMVGDVEGNSHPALFPDDSCPFLNLLPFEGERFKQIPSHALEPGAYKKQFQESSSEVAYSYLAASQMAMDHFNHRNTAIVPELATCPPTVRLVQRVWSSAGIGAAPLAFLENLDFFANLAPVSPPFEDNLPPNPSIDILPSNDTTWDSPIVLQAPHKYPCAILGPEDDRGFMGMVALSETTHIPQVSYLVESGLALGWMHPSTVGVVMGTEGRAQRVISYLKSIGRHHLVGLYSSGPQSQTLMEAFQVVAAQDDDFEVVAIPTPKASMESFKQAKQTGIRTIVLAIEANELELAAENLQNLSMSNEEYLFILLFHFFAVDTLDTMLGPHAPGTPLDALLSGALVVDRIDLAELESEVEDPFVRAWKQQNSSTVARINSMVPLNKQGAPYIQGSPDYFQTTLPSRWSSHIYDSVMAIGFGACGLAKQGSSSSFQSLQPHLNPQDPQGPSPPVSPSQGPEKAPGGPSMTPPASEDPLDGEKKPPPGTDQPLDGGKKAPPPSRLEIPLRDAMLTSDFTGASGRVRFDRDSRVKSRNEDDVYMGVYNIRPGSVDSNTGRRSYLKVLTSIWSPSQKKWQPVEGKEFLYGRGSEMPPPSYVVENQNFLHSWVRGLGYALLAVSWFLSIAGAAGVKYLENDEAVRRSQPFFQIVLCFGSAITSTSILTLSQDEGSGWTQSSLDAACVATPWFFFLGQVICFCTFFSKLWRLDQVLQTARRKVTVFDVSLPMAALCTVTTGILLAWTFVDPWTWTRDPISIIPPEVSDLFGGSS